LLLLLLLASRLVPSFSVCARLLVIRNLPRRQPILPPPTFKHRLRDQRRIPNLKIHKHPIISHLCFSRDKSVLFRSGERESAWENVPAGTWLFSLSFQKVSLSHTQNFSAQTTSSTKMRDAGALNPF
jgi:hypothetical protein